jgi:hypothetical protein
MTATSQLNPYASVDFEGLFLILESHSECVLRPRAGQPSIQLPYFLPDDLRTFYERCGGLTLYPDIAFPVTVLPPERVVLANPVITGLDREELIELGAITEHHPSWSCYTIAEDGNGDYFVIDLGTEHPG